MNMLLHICCACCLDQMIAGLQDEFGEGISVSGYFCNPNIHPLLEFRKRLKAVKVLNESFKIPISYDENYELEIFLQDVWQGGKSGKCKRCYLERLNATAKAACEGGFDCFSSTLCVSNQQNHEDIRQAAEEASSKWGISFIYRDFRKYSEIVPRRKGIYHQQYCGCIFSENERYRNSSKEVYKGNS
ncbi:MAG: epoxyqueuosine reductase QueH [Planctomycetota bacterium]|jgi:predicted adenine nucleotide alpha hydrolase (AANH) superfamily ATPase